MNLKLLVVELPTSSDPNIGYRRRRSLHRFLARLGFTGVVYHASHGAMTNAARRASAFLRKLEIDARTS